MTRRRVVVTGLGAITPIGNNLEEFWSGLKEGKSGGAEITKFDTENFTTKFACEVKDFDVLQYMDRKETKRMDLFSQYALASSMMAIEDSDINLEEVNKERFGVVYGSGIGGMETFEAQNKSFAKGGPRRISPFFVPMMISDIASGHISIKHGLKGPNYGVVSACATASNAIADAVMLIQSGRAELMISGGSEGAITEMSVGGFNAARALSTRNDNPAKASRPFDKERDGFVMGEGAGALLLEEYEHAKARGAKIYAELVGIGLTGDAYHVTAPPPEAEGAQRSMKAALADAGIQPTDIDYINAHGTSTPLNDVNETQAIKAVFGDHANKLSISSTKSMTGHLLGAAGAVESIASILAIRNSLIPPTINYEVPDPECDLDYTPNKPKEREVKYALSNTFGFGGHNASLIFKKFEG